MHRTITSLGFPRPALPPQHGTPPRPCTGRPLAIALASALLLPLPVTLTAADASPDTPPKRLKRSEAFLGIHFDFHAGPDCTEIGRNTTREMILNILDQVKPDYLQIDCKGHRGLCSYPTRVGNPAPGFVGDPLRLWREVTAQRGVSLYLHYSGVWDSEAIIRNPSWACVNPDGQPDKNATSPFGPYADQLLIPQLRELAGDYKVDGMWVDGECWAAIPDYGEAAAKAFREKTGIQEIPKQAGQPGWHEWMDFHREAFRIYLRHYVDVLKREHPDFEIASNWAFSDHMPEPVTADVAFLSGDFSPQNSLNSARFSARCLQNQGKPWDLMSWSFSGPQNQPARSLKSVPQLQQEAAIVLAQGGGYQAYFRQKRDGSIYDWHMKLMAAVARFCRARQEVCHRAEPVPQVALLYSRASHYRSSPRLFAPWGSPGIPGLRGVLESLLESQHSVQIVSEHHLAGRMSQWPLIVVPEWDYLETAFRNELLAYVQNGGSLLLVGPRTAALFAQELDVEFDGNPSSGAAHYLAHGDWLGGLTTTVQKVRLGPSARAFGHLHPQDDPRSPAEPAASVRPLGQGKIAAVYFNYGDRYLNARTPTARRFLQALTRELFPNPTVEVTGSSLVDVSVARNHKRLLVHLVNTSGPHADEKQHVFDEIPPVGPLAISLRLARAPQKVTLQPSGTVLSVDYADGLARCMVPQLDIHETLVIEE